MKVIIFFNSQIVFLYIRYVEEKVQRTGVAIETQGFSIVTSGRKRESLTVSIKVLSSIWFFFFCGVLLFSGQPKKKIRLQKMVLLISSKNPRNIKLH